ncbi:MAG TPA: RsiV family protein [Candidatus Lachnoclostridium stercorigallinarum]|uniref:RsiV family protein n=1 Tax=Candidatus Lachnoclostridium stercorigallinarum TaxID=2838634 RepID=A0A9D2GH03_9FIRM|nr:RsiV family protein [Candidatus Lachnoclostridium stercorigallinarum]
MEDWKRELKKQYEEIPVPGEARKRIEEGIQMAKEEKKRKNGAVIWLKRAGETAVAAVAAITVLVNVSPTAAQAMEQIPVIGSIAQVVTFRTYEDHSGRGEANVEIPQIEGEGQAPAANRDMEEYADSLIEAYESEIRASEGQGNYSLDSTYDVVFENDKYVCIRINTTVTMASGTQFVKIFTADKATGQTVSLMELVGNDEAMLTAISDNIKEQMREQMAADENVIYFLDSDMPDEDFKGLDGDESFYFSENGELIITFGEYEVAPGYMGAVEFVIPETVTGNLAG